MIGVDTNVLLRLIVGDDKKQQAAARALFDRRSPDEPVYVCQTVLLELVWSLGRTYGYPREQVLALLDELLGLNDVALEQQDLVAKVVDKARETKTGFPDIMVAMGNLNAGCVSTLTFDRAAAKRVEGMELLS